MSAPPLPNLPVVLSIAGTDPSGGAGIAADLRAFQAAGVAGVAVVTAALVQNSMGVNAIHKLPPRFIARQIDALWEDVPIAATKVGMLADAQIVSVVAERIGRRKLPNVVLDPVLAAKDGTPLLNPKGVQRLIEELCPRVLVLTPNIPEAEILTKTPIRTLEDAKEAAAILHGYGPKYVLIKGGHWQEGMPPLDLLFDGEAFTELTGERIEGRPVRGTGCLFSAALAAHLAQGKTAPEAAAHAKVFTARAIKEAAPIGKGARIWPGFAPALQP